MHYSIVVYLLGMVLRLEGALLVLPLLVGVIYQEQAAVAYLITALVSYALGRLLCLKKPAKFVFYAREGLATVALAWIVISMMGAVPFVLAGDIPSYSNALFETISGFTTTGASVIDDIEAVSHAGIFWRSFTHWVGGMGFIVFMLAIMPMTSSYNMQLMKAESPGPSVGKLVPKVRESAKLLYIIYFVMTVITILALVVARMPVFDAFCMGFGAAGTGGFGIHPDSAGSYTLLQQGILTVAVILFGVNFNAYYFLLGRDKKEAFRMDEVRWYLIIIAASALMITANLWTSGIRIGESLFQTFHHAIFQVGSIITTTGYSSVDFDLWPLFSKNILLILMFIGACAGSTGGGIKVSRIVILCRSVKDEVQHAIHPKSVSSIRLDGRPADPDMTRSVTIYLATYAIIFTLSLMILTLDGRHTFLTDFSAVAATFNNIGPGLDGVGPMLSFNSLSLLSKYVLMFDMLAGRLELYPMLVVFLPKIWRKY